MHAAMAVWWSRMTAAICMQAPLVAGSHQQGVASLAALATVVVTSALFGVVWRHTIRSPEDAADVQLKVPEPQALPLQRLWSNVIVTAHMAPCFLLCRVGALLHLV